MNLGNFTAVHDDTGRGYIPKDGVQMPFGQLAKGNIYYPLFPTEDTALPAPSQTPCEKM